MVQQASSFQMILEQIKPTYLDVPMYNTATISDVSNTVCVPAGIQTTVSMMQKILPDMSVLNSISETISALRPVFDSLQSMVDRMTPLWESEYIRTVNPEAVWKCMENEEVFRDEINSEVIDVNLFVADVTEFIQADSPKEAISKFQIRWKKIAKAAFGVIIWLSLEIAAGKIQFELQPLYQNTPHIAYTTEQFQNTGISSNQLEFAIFCIENLAFKLGISGDEAYRLLTSSQDILDGYVIPNYEILHTQDKEYIVNDIVDYMKECGVLK